MVLCVVRDHRQLESELRASQVRFVEVNMGILTRAVQKKWSRTCHPRCELTPINTPEIENPTPLPHVLILFLPADTCRCDP